MKKYRIMSNGTVYKVEEWYEPKWYQWFDVPGWIPTTYYHLRGTYGNAVEVPVASGFRDAIFDGHWAKEAACRLIREKHKEQLDELARNNPIWTEVKCDCP